MHVPLPADKHARGEEARILCRDGHQCFAAHALARTVDPAAVHRIFTAKKADKVLRERNIACRRIAVDVVENRLAVQRNNDNRRELLLPFLRGPDQSADPLYQGKLRIGSGRRHIRQEEHQRVSRCLVILFRQEDVVMDIEAGFPVSIGHPMKQCRLVQDQLPLVVREAVVHCRKGALLRFAVFDSLILRLCDGSPVRCILCKNAVCRRTAQRCQKQDHCKRSRDCLPQLSGHRACARTGRIASAPVTFFRFPPAAGGRVNALSHHAHTSQITNAPVNAAINVNGMPIRVKSPVETL